MSEVNPELQELAIEALNLALDCFGAGEENPFVLFVDESGQTHLVDVKDAEGNVTPQLVEEARHVVSQGIGPTALRYAIAYDGYLTTNGKRTDAAFVEAGNRGDPEAILIAQRYRVKKRSRTSEKVGPVTIIGSAEQLLE